ncbi:hypothetical protein lerEdw1_010662 [Lerista edwardsae]|nr:hypothetical protein lerEdw1_010662 [Lerista edwardsae]
MVDVRSGLEPLDFVALNYEQRMQLVEYKIDTRIANEKYLRSHKEVELLLSGFLREVFLQRPEDVREFAAEQEPEAVLVQNQSPLPTTASGPRLGSRITVGLLRPNPAVQRGLL